MLVDQPNHTLLNTLKIPSQNTVTFTWWLIPTRSMINRWVLLQLININRRFNQKKKKEVRLHYSVSGNFAEAAKPFGINESTMRGMIKAPPVPDIVKLSSKCNFPGAGWPLTYTVELDDELLVWIMDFGLIRFAFPSTLEYSNNRPLPQLLFFSKNSSSSPGFIPTSAPLPPSIINF